MKIIESGHIAETYKDVSGKGHAFNGCLYKDSPTIFIGHYHNKHYNGRFMSIDRQRAKSTH